MVDCVSYTLNLDVVQGVRDAGVDLRLDEALKAFSDGGLLIEISAPRQARKLQLLERALDHREHQLYTLVRGRVRWCLLPGHVQIAHQLFYVKNPVTAKPVCYKEKILALVLFCQVPEKLGINFLFNGMVIHLEKLYADALTNGCDHGCVLYVSRFARNLHVLAALAPLMR